MRTLLSLMLLTPACAPAPSSPDPASVPSVEVPAPRTNPPRASAPALPTSVAHPLVVAPKTALLPDSACVERPREQQRLLGFRPLPDAPDEARFSLVADGGVCKITTRARAELLLGGEESLEQVATCGAWRFEPCLPPPLHGAVPTPPFHDVRQFASHPSWQDMDAQSDGLGERRRESYTIRIEGSAFSLVYLRSGVVVLYAGEKRVDAFRAQAFVMLDGVPHLMTRNELVRIAEPPVNTPLPSLFTGDHAPAAQPHPLERQN